MDTIEILVVDDDKEIGEALCQYLSAEGFSAVWRNNGAEALLFLQQNPKIRLVLLDMRMPRMSGEEFLKIKTHTETIRDIPVFVITVASLKHVPEGAEALFQKPLDMNELIAHIQETISWTSSA